ncbi:MAG: hypothetical protein KatS3mg129_2005 [Leptospiraceae bacterium]|nr:MAG: hypothetical protein KatS3mg129_2005 [Leptospiraceae bacterium]
MKRILYKILNERIDKKTLRELWKHYYDKNKLNIKQGIERSNQKIKKSNIHSDQNIEIKSDNLFHQLLEKIEWYLERDTIPTEKILYHDFIENKKELDNLFKMIHVGLKSVQDIIPVITKNDIYVLSKPYLIKHKEELLNKYKNKLQELEGIKIKEGKVISLKIEKDKIDLYKNIINILNQL